MRQHQLRQQSFDTSNMKKKNDRLRCVMVSLPQVGSYNVFNFRPQLKSKPIRRAIEEEKEMHCLL